MSEERHPNWLAHMWVDGIVEGIEKSIENLKSSDADGYDPEPIVDVVRMLAEVQANQVLDMWIDALFEPRKTSPACELLAQRLTQIRYANVLKKLKEEPNADP